jgi:LEA14-like dessication related protein
MKKSVKIFLLFLIIIALFAGVFFYLNPKKALLIIFPDINEVENVHIRLLKDTALIDLDLKLQNKSILKLNIDSFIYRVRLDTTTILHRSQETKIILSPGQKEIFKMPLALSFTRIKKQIKDLQGTDSVNLDVELEIVYSTLLGRTTLPVNRTYRIAVPRPPEIKLLGTEYVGREKKVFFVNAYLRVINYSKYDLNLTRINYKMYVSDLFEVEDKFPGKIHVKPYSNEDFTIPLKLEFNRLLKTAFLVITNQDVVPYKLKITAMVGSKNTEAEPVPVELEKQGSLELRKKKR